MLHNNSKTIMEFKNFSEKIQKRFVQMAHYKLFRVSLPNSLDENGNDKTGEMLWDLYITSFKAGDDPVFRDPNSTTHTCNNDKNFIRRYGNVVAIVDNQIVTMWGVELKSDSPYYLSAKAMDEALRSGTISGVFVESFQWLNKANYEKTKNKNVTEYRLGIEKSYKQYSEEEVKKYGVVNSKDIFEFHHFHVYLPKKFVDFSSKSIESILGELRTTKQVFDKGLNIPLETLELVRDLIQQGSLLRGDIYLPKVKEFINLKKKYNTIIDSEKNLWSWNNFSEIPFARFANELIGTTCIELAEGKDINKVCKDFNYRIDPVNYGKAKAPVTKAMVELAEKQIFALGYENSFDRRFANISDIDISEIKHSNIDNSIEKPVGLFAKAGVPAASHRHKRTEFDKVETVGIDKFMVDILPNATSLEVFLENRMESNLVSLFTSIDKADKNPFSWTNLFSWTYNGNLSGKSMIKENVKAAGGRIEALMRCSLQWNDEETKGDVDFDLHCKSSVGAEIYYSNKTCYKTKGWLDVDMIRPAKIGIENITWQKNVPDGVYIFFVRNFCGGSNKGFKAEIEIDGETYNYHYQHSTYHKQDVQVATVTVKNGSFTVTHHLTESSTAKKMWNLETNQFHKVSLVCTSPNHWGDNNIGTKEYFFMLQDCKSDVPMRAFHTDQLNSELLTVRKALDMLGNYKLVQPSDKQLSGVGFNSTVRDEVIVKVKGTHQRILKIKF